MCCYRHVSFRAIAVVVTALVFSLLAGNMEVHAQFGGIRIPKPELPSVPKPTLPSIPKPNVPPIDPLRDARRTGGDISRETRNGVVHAGQALEKPFRHLNDNAKEAVFFGMRNHVIGKNNELGTRERRFGRGHKYYDFIQPHLPPGMDFGQISWYFDAYVPSGMAGITFDNYVYIAWSYRDFDPQHLHLMAHETGHAIQYRQWGTKGFARRYVDDSFGSWTKYPNFNQVKIHDSMNIERDADAFANRVMNTFNAHMNAIANQNTGPNSQFNQNTNQTFPPRYPQGQTQPPLPNQGNEGEMIAGAILQGFGQVIDARQRQEREMRMRPAAGIPNSGPTLKLGIHGQPVNGRGVFVTSVDPGSPANRAGIEPNDFIVEMDGVRVFSGPDLTRALGNIAAARRRSALVVVENHRLNHLPVHQRYATVQVQW